MTYSNNNAGVSPLLDVLTREGVLINVSCRYWRAAKKLQAQDLGLDPDYAGQAGGGERGAHAKTPRRKGGRGRRKN